jgi:hypothetical protein
MTEAIFSNVFNRGTAPRQFIDALIEWGKTAQEEIFAPNPYHDVYGSVVGRLGPWRTGNHRRAVMLEVMRVLAGFESSWAWNAGVDTSNPRSQTPLTAEAGAWQVSADSMNFGSELRDLVKSRAGSLDPLVFQRAMKEDHILAMEYIARLLRRTTQHNGPVKRHEINDWLLPKAVIEFQNLLET